MLRDIIKKEILDNLTSSKFIFTFVLCTILILLSIYTGIANYSTDKKEHAQSVATVKQGLNPPNTYDVILSGALRVYRQPQVLGTVVNGIEEVAGRVSSVSSTIENSLAESKNESNPIFAVFGPLDLMFIVKIVLSLFAILFTYDAIVGEKEKGTLKLALSNSIPRDRLILGKAIGGYISLLLPLLIPLLLSLIILLLAPNLALGSDDWIRLLFIFFMFFVYLSVFFSLGLFVSSMTSRSSTSFLVLLFIWIVFVMVIPKVAVVAAGQIRPIPSIHEIATQKGLFMLQAQQEYTQAIPQILNKIDPALRKDPKAYQQAYTKIFDNAVNELNLRISENNAKIDRDYQLKKDAQQSLAMNLSRISPASALTFGSMSLARTGIDEYTRFLNSTRAYKPVIRNWYYTNSSLRDPATGRVNQIDLKVISGMPKNSFEPERLSQSLARTLPDFGLMLAMIVIFFVGAYVSFLRYDVR
jgi:ABC-type transport system involved in multi-copper enzyme maturation permease subunit